MSTIAIADSCQLERPQAGGDGAVDRRVHDRLEIPARCRVGEHDRAELRPIDGARRRRGPGAEPRGDRLRRFGSGAGHAVRELVGVETGGTAAPEALQHVALAGGDTAGQRDFQHLAAIGVATASSTGAALAAAIRLDCAGTVFCPSIPALCCAAVSVFLSSIAIVSGPTPPGTGVRAPATLFDFGVDVADDQRATPLERLVPLRSRREQALDRGAVLDLRRADVDHRRARLHELGGHERRLGRSPPRGCRRCARRRADRPSGSGRS